MEDLFSALEDTRAKPLAERMRPKTLSEFVGQKHIVSKGSLLERAILADKLGSCIFYGPSGTGKTTLANIIANTTRSVFKKLNAVSSGVADAKKVIEDAKNDLRMYGRRTYLLLDECHRWSKAQSDSVLSAIEDGTIIFIGSTTENPHVSMTKAIVSRCRVFEFLPLVSEDIVSALKWAAKSPDGLGNANVKVEEDAYKHLAWASNGDLRTALNALELAFVTTPAGEGGIVYITKNDAVQSIQKQPLSVDESMYYDMISAFCKSLRGTAPDAAVFWALRLIEAGCDPLLICRRLIVHSSEDVGLADSNALVVAVSAMTAFEKIGLPEGLIPLTHAIIYVACAPKSNSVVNARGAAHDALLRNAGNDVPHHLRDRTFTRTVDDGSEYRYPHDEGGYLRQEYLPKSLSGARFYEPSGNGKEAEIREFLKDKRN